MFDSNTPDLSTKDRLVATAAELLIRQSYGTVSVDDICKAASIQKGTFYHYFPSKVELALAAYDFMWAFGREKMDHCFSPTLPPEKRLERYADLSYKFHKELFEKEGHIYGCPLVSAGQELGTQDERIRQKIREIFDGQCMYFESVLRDLPAFATLPREKLHGTACRLFSYALGVLYQAKVVNDPDVIKRDMLIGLQELTGLD